MDKVDAHVGVSGSEWFCRLVISGGVECPRASPSVCGSHLLVPLLCLRLTRTLRLFPYHIYFHNFKDVYELPSHFYTDPSSEHAEVSAHRLSVGQVTDQRAWTKLLNDLFYLYDLSMKTCASN